jgi:ubiquinone/menaquinone biosynthesis C-methylase UbiE
MRKEWDDRAREDARYYVATGNRDWTDQDFFESGRSSIRQDVTPDLAIICAKRDPSQMKVLEIGCGAGRMTRGFTEMFGFVDAVDISTEMVAAARAALSDRTNVRFHVTDGSSLSSFSDNSFDFVFSQIVFQHIPRKWVVRNYIRHAFRVLRPNSVFKFQVQGVPIRDGEASTWVGVGFTRHEMQSIADRCGFRILSTTGEGTQYFWLTFLKP